MKHTTHEIEVGPISTDVVIGLPNGEKITVQFRLEGTGSIDFNIPKGSVVYCWKNDEMDGSPVYDDSGDTGSDPSNPPEQHVRADCKQIMVCTEHPWFDES